MSRDKVVRSYHKVVRRHCLHFEALLTYDRVHEGMSQNHLCGTYRTQIIPGGAWDCSELIPGASLRLQRVLVCIDDIQNLEDEFLSPKTRRDRASAV